MSSSQQQQCSSSPLIAANLLALPENDDKHENENTNTNTNTNTLILDQLQKLNRAQLLQLFLESKAPTPSELSEFIVCEHENGIAISDDDDDDDDECHGWNGILLDNNSKIMDLSSNIMTHTLFGGIGLPWRYNMLGGGDNGHQSNPKKRGMWNGKTFSSSKPSTTTIKGKGINRFVMSSSIDNRETNEKENSTNNSNSNNNNNIFKRHEFDYSIEDSKLLPGTKSLQLKYANYQLPISLWYTMMDELRVIAIPGSTSTSSTMILIGMGWMGWDGVVGL